MGDPWCLKALALLTIILDREQDDRSEEQEAEIEAECIQAQALIVERQAAIEQLPELQKAAQSEEEELSPTLALEEADRHDLIDTQIRTASFFGQAKLCPTSTAP